MELAKLAGVSSATVSRAFTPDARISKTTRERILSSADEHGYRPNAVARSLNKQPLPAGRARGQRDRQSVRGAGAADSWCIGCSGSSACRLVLCCADYGDRTQLMRFASAYQVEHVVLCSDMVSAADAVDIFRSAVPIIASFEPMDDPASPACGSTGQKRLRARSSSEWSAAAGVTSPTFPAANPAGSTSSACLVRLCARTARTDIRGRGARRLLLQVGLQGSRDAVATRVDRCRYLRQRRHGDRRSGCRGETSGAACPKISRSSARMASPWRRGSATI